MAVKSKTPALRTAESAKTRADVLAAAARERILIIDGAMGTMIQRHKFSESDYRGKRFADWRRDVQGNNDLLSLTQPELRRDCEISGRVVTGPG